MRKQEQIKTSSLHLANQWWLDEQQHERKGPNVGWWSESINRYVSFSLLRQMILRWILVSLQHILYAMNLCLHKAGLDRKWEVVHINISHAKFASKSTLPFWWSIILIILLSLLVTLQRDQDFIWCGSSQSSTGVFGTPCYDEAVQELKSLGLNVTALVTYEYEEGFSDAIMLCPRVDRKINSSRIYHRIVLPAGDFDQGWVSRWTACLLACFLAGLAVGCLAGWSNW